jgi:hypothetical protein
LAWSSHEHWIDDPRVDLQGASIISGNIDILRTIDGDAIDILLTVDSSKLG